ncbi:hypothetical protein F5B21DRAFT_237106 [Xylaria acuta]|nr:hypothetical protein F5B21DRAFT_237106 [Xylaria acuta]
MASEQRRPPTRNGSGSSRPPTSRFQEGSMNDRTSAAPPAQFMGPEQLEDYENQFYKGPPTMHEARRPRPFSASGQLQAATVPRHADGREPQQQHQPQKHTIAHKKSTGFFGRVRDALFHRGQHGPAALRHQEVRRKHSSLQEPLQHSHMPPPPRPDYLQHAQRTQSEINIAQMSPDPRGGGGGIGDRPSREDVLASYNQLVAAGFFQSHAIQSTRHAAPTAAAAAAAAAGVGGRQTPVLPMDYQAAPRPPVRIPSIRTAARPGSVSPMPAPAPSPSPNPKGRNSREYAAATMAAPAAPRTSLSSLFRPSIPDLHTKESWYALRGRKRTRGDGDETPVVTPEPQSSSSTSYFTEPLRRVAKKLRSSSQLNEKATTVKDNAAYTTQEPSHDNTSSDGMMRLVPSISDGGSLQPNERPIRLRSPSPAAPEMTAAGHSERRSERPIREPVISTATRARRPRRTFSYTVTESARGRTRASERERERERERDTRRRLQRRGSSATRADDENRSSSSSSRTAVTRSSSRQTTTRPQNPLGQWQRVSLEDTVVHRDSSDSTRSQWDWEWEQRQNAEVRIATSSPNTNTNTNTTNTNKLRKKTTTPTQSPAPAPAPSTPLRAMPAVNRSVAKTPERWHHSGKAYHLKDRGSRPNLTVLRRSEDSGKGEEEDYGKENDNNWRHHSLDADGDVDVLGCENRRPREEKSYEQQQQQLHQWRIGNAL